MRGGRRAEDRASYEEVIERRANPARAKPWRGARVRRPKKLVCSVRGFGRRS